MTHRNNCTCSSCAPIVVQATNPTVINVTVPTGAQSTQSTVIVRPGQGGARGVQGTQGIQGIQGIQGLTPPIAYTHNQGSPSNSWIIYHNLDYYPNVTIVDSGGTICEGDYDYLTRNTVTATFSSPFSGKAYLS